MRRASRAFVFTLAGIAIAIAGTVYAVGSGGFPSRPWLKSLGIGEAAPTATGALQITGSATVGGGLGVDTTPPAQGGVILGAPTGGNTLTVYSVLNGTADAERIYGASGHWAGFDLIDGQGSNAQWSMHSGYCDGPDPGALDIYDAQSGKSAMCLGTNDALNVEHGSLLAQGIQVQGRPLTVASIGGNPTCTVISGINAASCVRNSQGYYTLNFSTPYPVTPICVASSLEEIAGQLPIVAEVSPVTTTYVGITMQQANTAGSFWDGTAYVICH